MTMTDPIADYLTRIRNAQMASKGWTDIPASKLKIRLSYVLKEESFIRDYILIKGKSQDNLRIFLNYDFSDKPVIHGLKRISKPGLRIYTSKNEIPRYLNGLGVAFLSTPKGIMTGYKAKKLGVGGELLFYVW